MKFEEFQLERQQSTWENKVDYNLSESGVHPRTLSELFEPEFVDQINNTELNYGFTEVLLIYVALLLQYILER